uniref:Uncharacterized protein n=1 Tax=Anguilla anguilla TaxID=7936 RepID=A0A0E9QDA9_ANGAN
MRNQKLTSDCFNSFLDHGLQRVAQQNTHCTGTKYVVQ